jgi:hypothetical protein
LDWRKLSTIRTARRQPQSQPANQQPESSQLSRKTHQQPPAFSTLQRTKGRVPEWRAYHAHRSPSDVSTSLTNRAMKPPPEGNNLGLSRILYRTSFIPATLMGFHLQGLSPPGDQDASPRLVLPCRYVAHSDATTGFEGLIPPGSSSATEATPPALLALSPLRFSLSPPCSPASWKAPPIRLVGEAPTKNSNRAETQYKLKANATQTCATEYRQWRAGFTAAKNPKIQGRGHRPLWGLSPRHHPTFALLKVAIRVKQLKAKIP